MRSLSIRDPKFLQTPEKPRLLDRIARRLVLGKLQALQSGRVILHEQGERSIYGDTKNSDALTAEVTVYSPAFYSDVAFGGTTGSGEAFIRGYWDSPNVELLVRILLRNRDVIDEMDSGVAIMSTPLRKVFHWLNRNTRKGSRRNIAAHYDLGNDFYALWLDRQMMYSCAYYPQADATLDTAAVAKLDRICRKLDLQPSDRVVEIGTGWGGFAIHAARNYGCHVTTTTISQQQFDYASERVKALGLEDRVSLLLRDYRDLEGEYDKLVSVEMIEAIGHEYMDVFFAKCSSLLKSDGQMFLQAITIADQRYEAAKKTVDFIKRYVFPGGFLPSNTAIHNSMTRATDLRSLHVEDIGLHYAATLRDWRRRFFEQIAAVRALGYSEQFLRLWQFYLCYCEGAFEERSIGAIQMHAMKPNARPAMRNAL